VIFAIFTKVCRVFLPFSAVIFYDTVYPTAKLSQHVNVKYSPRITISTPYTDRVPSNSTTKCRNFSYLLYLAFLSTWSFSLRCYKYGRVLLSRWWLIRAS